MTVEELNKLYSKAKAHAEKYSDDVETKVGAIMDSRSWVKITAANTFIDGAKNLPNTRPDKYQYIIHAEANLVAKAAAMGFALEDEVVFCTLSPCQNCIRTLFQAGVREVYYKELHHAHNPDMRDIKVTETKVGPYTKMVLENYEC